MYNRVNVQPQNPYTGQNQQPVPAQALPNVPPTGVGTPVSTPQPVAAMPNAHPARLDPTSIESWAAEVNNAVATTQQSPHGRANALFEIRSRYQRDVLGYKPQVREG